ncbi:MAG: hypothetical protein KF763_08385 [Cyclobacteriaceae bacterium]|nr:hypothetical protein [Cyclobacteriaceae bacterium]
MTRYFSFVLTLIILISGTMVWSSSFTDNQRAEEGVEPTEERTEGEVSSFAASYFSKVRKPSVKPVAGLISSSHHNSVQVDDLLAHTALYRYQTKNTNKPIYIFKQVFLI